MQALAQARQHMGFGLAAGKPPTGGIVLPRYLTVTAGADNGMFEGAAGVWTTDHGGIEVDQVNYRVGTQSTKFTVDGTLWTSASAKKVIDEAYDAGNPVRFYFYVANQVTASEYVRYKISLNSIYSNTIFYTINRSTKGLHTGWNSIDVYPNEWSLQGTGALPGTFIRFEMLQDPPATSSMVVSHDSLVRGQVNRPCVLLTFDDGTESTYTEALPLMAAHNMKGTMYVIPEILGTSTFMTEAQMLALAAAGWCIGVHDDTNWTTLSIANMETAILACQSYLTSVGLTQNIADLAYPNGAWNQDILNSLDGLGIETARTIIKNGVMIPGGDNDLVLAGWSIAHTDTLATVEAYVDAAVLYNRPISLVFHHLVAGTPGSSQWRISDFAALLDYLVASELPVITIQNYRDLRNGDVTIPVQV